MLAVLSLGAALAADPRPFDSTVVEARSAYQLRNVGIGLTAGGIVCTIAGGGVFLAGAAGPWQTGLLAGAFFGTGLGVIGQLLAIPGATMWTVGSMRYARRAEALDRVHTVHLQVAPAFTKHGGGLALDMRF